MTDSRAVAALLSWCEASGFWIDPRIQVISGPCGVAVISQEQGIPADTVLVRIPRESVLSVKSCSLSELIPAHLYGHGAQLSLALALSAELVNGPASKWSAYLQSLPREIPGIPIFWTGGANNRIKSQDGDATDWLKGTEAARILSGGLVRQINEYYEHVAHPIYVKALQPGAIPSLRDFYRAYSLVSSRAFLVDAFHGLSMVPIADAFNHIHENHVHLESDFDVCPECGSLQRCLHDDAPDLVPRSKNTEDTNAEQHDNFYEMVSNLAIPPNVEIFNTYGETLTNAQLLVQYGFILDVNENDCITWTSTELAQFSENNMSGTWTWDAVGGLAYFDALLGSLVSMPWDGVSHSQMVHLDRARQFVVNGDASVSHGLYLYFALLLILRNSPPSDHHIQYSANEVKPLLKDLFQRQLAFEQLIALDEDEETTAPQLLDDADAPYSVILEVAGLLASLCRARSAQTGKAGIETIELGDILDRLPNDMTPTKMAISLALTERSLLDSCMASWEALHAAASSRSSSRLDHASGRANDAL